MDNSTEKAFQEAINLIIELSGDCPFGMYGYYNDCTDNCYSGKYPDCWEKYLKSKGSE